MNWRLFFIVIIILSSNLVFSQSYKDCQDALEICGESPFVLEFEEGVGLNEFETENYCVTNEYSSLWITWTIEKEGLMTFVLSPLDENQDIDFVVFKLVGENCDNKEMIRCMASGAVFSLPPSAYESCLGETGLAFGEFDVEETSGCAVGDNNFLAPLDTEKGDVFVMAVMNFSNDGQPINLSFGGEAEITCITSAVDDEVAKDNLPEMVPTLSDGNFIIRLRNKGELGSKISIYDYQGRCVLNSSRLNYMLNYLDLAHLANGTYVAQLVNNDGIAIQRFVIAR